MPCVIIVEVKKSPRVRDFAREAGQIMQMKGYRLIGDNPATYFNPTQTIAPADTTSLLKMIKAIQTYPQVVKKIIYSSSFRAG